MNDDTKYANWLYKELMKRIENFRNLSVDDFRFLLIFLENLESRILSWTFFR
jgi:hypothetical protein